MKFLILFFILFAITAEARTNWPAVGAITDTVSEATAGSGVTIDGVLLKDNDVAADAVGADTITDKAGTGAPNLSQGVELGGVAVSASATEINKLFGTPAGLTSTELGYVDGVTSAIQTQLDAKVNDTGNESIAGVKTFTDNLVYKNCGVVVGRSTLQSIASGAPAKVIVWNSEIQDSCGVYNTGTGAYVAPRTGFYLVTGSFIFNTTTSDFSGTTEFIDLIAFVNGTQGPYLCSRRPYTDEQYPGCWGSAVVYATSGQSIDIRVTQTSGAALNIYADTDISSGSFHYLGNP